MNRVLICSKTCDLNVLRNSELWVYFPSTGLSCNSCGWTDDLSKCKPSPCIAEHIKCVMLNDNGFYFKGCRSEEGVKKDSAICDPNYGCKMTVCETSNCN